MLQLQHKTYRWINSQGFIVYVLTYHEDTVQESTYVGNLLSKLGTVGTSSFGCYDKLPYFILACV